MWPDVLKDMSEQIKARLLDINIEIDIYFGSSAEVPQKNQINMYRGDRKPSLEQTYCDPDDDISIYIDLWINEETSPAALNDVEYENSRTMAGYQKLALISKQIRSAEYSNDNPEYSAEIVKIEGDQGAFRPTCGERIEYEIEIKSSS